MNRTTKGALAATTAGILLLGGAGSLAYWTGSHTVTGDDFSSGTLALTDADEAAASWTLNGVAVADPSAVLLVPGDEVALTETYDLAATGDNLQGTMDVTGGVFSGTLADKVTTTATVTLEDGTSAPIAADETFTEANDGDGVTVSLTVAFPFGTASDNTSQGMTLDLTDVVVSMTQTDASPDA